MRVNPKILGNKGENMALKYLKSKGYKIIEQNFTCMLGEIDIMARHDGFLVFVEVKTRTSNMFGRPAEAVDYRKQEKIRKIALYYQRVKGLFSEPVRFDVVEVLGDEINLIDGAF